jgi:hypothetical protein
MDSKFLIILAIILFILIILNHVAIVVTPSSKQEDAVSKQFGYVQTPTNCSNVPGCCSLTQFGCCPDGVNSRADLPGSNCPVTYFPGYNVSNATSTIIQNNVPPQNTFIPPQNIIKPLRV